MISKKRICWINQYNENGKFSFYRIETRGNAEQSIPCDSIKELIIELNKILKEKKWNSQKKN